MERGRLHVYTDGASRKDGRGGWGFVVYRDGREYLYDYGGEHDTTIGRMELTAAIRALESLRPPQQITLYCDSQYVVKGITEHMDVWLMTNWRGTGNKIIKNQDLWEKLGHLDCDFQVTWEWVKGHTGVVGNERADYWAGRGVPEKQRQR